jgi:hypothetical protein
MNELRGTSTTKSLSNMKQAIFDQQRALNNINKRFFRIPQQMLLARFFTEC